MSLCAANPHLNLFCLKAKNLKFASNESKMEDFTPFIAADVMTLRT